LGGAQVSPLLQGFSPAFFLFALFVFGCLFAVFSASQPVKRLLQVIPVSPFLLSHISRVDRPCSVLARQKKDALSESLHQFRLWLFLIFRLQFFFVQ